MIHALHGAIGHFTDWRPIISNLAKNGQSAKAIDLWRFLDCCSLSLNDTGAAINHEAIAHQDQNRILLGYSMGGRLALHALLDNPKLWKAAILIAPHTGLTTAAQRSERLKSDAQWAAKALDSEWQDFLKEWNTQSVLSDTPTPDRKFLKQRRRAIALSFTAWSLGMQQDLLPHLHKIKCPILWITGEQDKKFCSIAMEAVHQLPNAQHAIVKNAGHRVVFSHAGIIAGKIDEFINHLQ